MVHTHTHTHTRHMGILKQGKKKKKKKGNLTHTLRKVQGVRRVAKYKQEKNFPIKQKIKHLSQREDKHKVWVG